MQELNFSLALNYLKQGFKIQRTSQPNTFIFLVEGSRFQVSRAPLNAFYPEGTWIDYNSHIDMKTADGSIVPWTAFHSDLLANDWQVLDSHADI